MREVFQLMLALLFPLVCLGMLLWLARLEETLGRDVRRSGRRPDPAPILKLPATVAVEPGIAPRTPPQTAEGVRSVELSLGGSTKR